MIMVGIFLLTPAVQARAANLGDLIEQQRLLDEKIKQNQDLADQKAGQAVTLESQIGSLEKDIANTEASIAQTNNQITTVQSQIVEVKNTITSTQKELDIQVANFNQAVVELYRTGRQSKFEKLLSSTDLSDALEKTTYLDSLQANVYGLVTEIKDTKSKLESEKTGLDEKNSSLQELNEQQKAAKYSAEALMGQKSSTLGMTQADKAKYEGQIADLQKEMASVSAAIYTERQKGRGGESFGDGGSGYPYGSIDEPDAWGFLTRECTSYAAWAWNARFGKNWHNTQPGRGSARYWPEIAGTLGYSVSSTPREGAIISWYSTFGGDQWGHVAIVEAVNGNGTIDISEYNWLKYSYSYRKNVNPGSYGGYSYIY